MRKGQVVIHVEPLKGNRLSGIVYVDEVRLYCLPKLELKVDAPHHVALPDQPLDIECTVLGISDARSSVSFKLIDHMGNVLDRTTAPLSPALPTPSTASNTATSSPFTSDAANSPFPMPEVVQKSLTSEATPVRGGKLTNTAPKVKPAKQPAVPETVNNKNSSNPSKQRLDGVAHWRLRVPQPGYYRVVVDLGRASQNSETRQISRQISLAIMENSKAGVGGPFGWSLPDFTGQFTPESVPEMVKLGGVGWLKIPVWFDPRDTQTAERLSVLLERLDLRKVHCVGLLDRPISLDSNQKSRQPAAAIFSSPADWEAQLEPALTRMSMKLSWFQLGRDNDRSFVGNPNLIPLVTDIRNRMQTYSQELQLALSWDYQDPIPTDRNLPWRASQMSSDPQLTPKELRSYLSDPERPEHTRWVTLNPIPASRYRTLDRVRDLAERMITVKEKRIEAAFVTSPLDSESGIFNPDGSVGELFLPWRLLNQNLATASYLGSINMPGGSTNFIFADGQSGFMIMWNDRTAVEQLYLGDQIKATDLWGRPLEVEQVQSDRHTPEQRIKVTPWPILLRGVSVQVANWRMRFKLENKSLPSIMAMRTVLPIYVENTLGQSAYGTVNLHSTSLLQPGIANLRMQLGEGAGQRLELPIPVRQDASAGKHSLRFDFQVTADREYEFSTYDTLTLGIGDVEMVWEALDVQKDRVALRVELTNSTSKPVSFDCKLFPYQQPYRRFQISNAPPGSTQRDLVLPLEEFKDEMRLWIRCEEIGTGRVLNYQLPLKLSSEVR